MIFPAARLSSHEVLREIYSLQTPYIGDNINVRLWESCQRFDGRWFYTGKDDSQSVQWALRNLVDTVSRGGNLLLNMGPTPEGLLPPRSVAKLKPLGAWLRKYGESIYGVQRGPHYLLDWGTCTRRGNTLYYQIADWPHDSKLVIPGLNASQPSAGIQRIAFLGEPDSPSIAYQRAGQDVVVTLPKAPIDPLMSVLKVELDGVPVVNNAIRPLGSVLRPQTGNAKVNVGDYYLPGEFAQIHGEKLHFSLGTGAGGQRENLKGWTDPSEWPEWEILVDRPGTYELSVTYSSWMKSGVFAVEIVGESLEHMVMPGKLKGRKSPLAAAFRTVSLGRVHLDKAGTYQLAVKAVEIDAQAIQYDQGLMMLREVVLSPTK